jgi:hypothetical protein
MLDMRGVIIFGIDDGLIAWARLSMEETEANVAAIDQTVRHLTRTSQET